MVRRAVIATLLGGLLLLGPNAALANYHEGKQGERNEQAKPPEKSDDKSKAEQPKSDADKQEEARRTEGDRHEGEGEREHEGDGDGRDGRRYYGDRYYHGCGYYGCGYYDYDRGYNSSFVANMTPDQELKPGPAGSRGRAVLDVDSRDHRVCYRLDYDGISKPTGAHIHHGRAGMNGPVAVALDQGDEGCVGADRGLLREIQASPHDFYVNIHTAEYPDGAIRGQLEYPSEARH
jgi:CHRD domain-containing protein